MSMYTKIMAQQRHSPTPGYLVWKLAGTWRLAADRALAPHGLTHAQYVVLSTLYGMHSGAIGAERHPSQRQLADHAGLEALYLSRLVRSLETAGLVERNRDKRDTRTVRLTLTERGREIAQPAMAAIKDLADMLLAPIGGPDSDRSRVFVNDLRTLLNSQLPAPR